MTIQAATSQESSGTKETTEKDSTTSADTAENKNQIIEIADEKAFEEFLQNCQYDSWSVGKTVKLTHNIDLSKVISMVLHISLEILRAAVTRSVM